VVRQAGVGGATVFAAEPLSLLDAHLDYDAEAMAAYPVPATLEIPRRNAVRAIQANSTANDGTRVLVGASSPTWWSYPSFAPIAAIPIARLGSRTRRPWR